MHPSADGRVGGQFGVERALDQRGVRVTFVLPKAVASDDAAHVDLISPQSGFPQILPGQTGASAAAGDPPPKTRTHFKHTRFIGVRAAFMNPYQTSTSEGAVGQWTEETARAGDAAASRIRGGQFLEAGFHEYGGDLIDQVERYAYFCLDAAQELEFDVIHAHDWMTYPAGLWIARATGKPLVIHVHSTEFDRSGEHVNQRVYDIERRGMHGAMRVVCVSSLTRNTVVHRYGVPESHAEVVYNGVEIDAGGAGLSPIRSKDKIVLYFGRITFQKGPEYFLRAAKRVLDVMEDVKFVVAGSGDMARHMIEMAANMGIGHKVLFTGFLRGNDIRKVFSLADLYVMPSVSEPFGIAPLEAMSHDVPVIISKSSGVSEVLSHALKVDFWDVEDMANKVIAVLRHPPLQQTLKEHGRFEVRGITWDGAAHRCLDIYHAVAGEMTRTAAGA